MLDRPPILLSKTTTGLAFSAARWWRVVKAAVVCLCSLVVVLIPAGNVQAQLADSSRDVPQEPTGLDVPPLDLSLMADLGGSKYSATKGPGGFTFGATGLLRYDLFAAGLYAQGELGPLFSRAASAEEGILAGFAWRSREGFRLDVLATLGIHYYQGWGSSSDLLDSDNNPGASATVPSSGGRLRFMYVFSPMRHNHFTLGLQWGMVQDWHKVQRSYNYQSCDNGLFGTGACTTASDRQLVGGFHWTLGILLGMAFDLGG